jgi:penicillin amidase/acyl-homoserine-lactone acylase
MFRFYTAIFALTLIAMTASQTASGQLSADEYDVRILRDTWGVPHIFGKTDADVGFGLAYAQSEDNFVTVQETLMTTRGTMGLHTGQAGATTDFIVALLRVNEFVEEKYETDLSPELRAVLEAFAEGVNHYGKKFPDQLLRDDLLPVTGKDIAAGFVFRAPFFVGLDGAIRELMGKERRREVSQKMAAADALADLDAPYAISAAHDYLTNGEEMGSNGTVLSKNRTADGSTMLLVNPHLAWEGPTTWYEVHLHSEEGWNMTGGLFPGSPIVTLGHNENLGWTHTVNAPDLVDIYVLEMHPKKENKYRYGKKWLDLEEKEITLRVKMTEKMNMPVRRQLYYSVHGPVMKTDHGVYAIRYAGFGDIRSSDQWYRMNKASNYEEFKAAMNMRAIHSFNTIYADKDGVIWGLYNAMLPNRTEGYDYKKYLPGDTPETMWDTYLPLDELPQLLNPANGFIQNNNSDPFHMTFGEENMRREDFSSTHGIETRITNRTMRALELFEADDSVTWEEFEAYKFDLFYSKNSGAARAWNTLVNAPAPTDPLLKEAMEVVRAWDLGTHEDNTSTALALTTVNRAKGRGVGGTLDENEAALMEQLGKTAKKFKEVYGRLDIPWQQFNRVQKGSHDVGVGGGPDILHCVTPRYIEDGARSKGRHGDGYTAIVKWDKDGNLTSKSYHQYGAATTDESSPHYADQMELARTRTMKPVWFTEKDIRANLEREYTPFD